MFARLNCLVFICVGLVILFSTVESAAQERGGSMIGQIRELDSDKFLSREHERDMQPVKMSATYYFGNADKETVPVLLLHDFEGSRKDFSPLVDMLVKANYAVLSVDLRGHGKSTKRFEATPPRGRMPNMPPNMPPGPYRGQPPRPPMPAPPKRELQDFLAADFGPNDHLAILRADLPLLRNTLMDAHSASRINLNRLVVVGIGNGAAAAAYWTMQDWRSRDAGRFTKTLVLIAPKEFGDNGDYSKAFAANRSIRQNVAVMLAVPEGDEKSQAIAKKLEAALLSEVENANNDSSLGAPFLVFPYPVNRVGKDDEEGEPMTIVEIFSNASRAKLGKAVFDFIADRNDNFPENAAKWSKLK